MGTQGGGWGNNDGMTVFSEASLVGNGQVHVTCHEPSWQDTAQAQASCESPRKCFQEWRVLRFGEDTRQSVVRVTVLLGGSEGVTVAQQPDCLAFLYTKTVAAAVASLVGLAPEGSRLQAALLPQQQQAGEGTTCRVLCVGLGGGSIPLFLTHHFAGMEVEVVELDPVVIRAAIDALGFPAHRPRLTVHEADAIDWIGGVLKERGTGCFDLVFLDAFDSENEVPSALTTPGSPFLENLAAAVHPGHGVVLTNLHTSEPPSLPKKLLSYWQGGWHDPYVTPRAQATRDAILKGHQGCAYTLGVGKQYNAIVVIARGSHLSETKALPMRLKEAALSVSKHVQYSFPAAARASLDFKSIP